MGEVKIGKGGKSKNSRHAKVGAKRKMCNSIIKGLARHHR